jgi:hypothetical protein
MKLSKNEKLTDFQIEEISKLQKECRLSGCAAT